jgi:hypothetical protein
LRVIRKAPFAVRVVERKGGRAAIIYRRRADESGRDRLQRVAAIAPLAFTASTPLLREAVVKSQESLAKPASAPIESDNGKHTAAGERPQFGARHLMAGAFYPLGADWGARVACFALLAAGLRDAERLNSAANHLRGADGDEAAWWLGLLSRADNVRALRALRILTEAVE